MNLYDTDMNVIGLATAEQIEAADSADGGWIWIDTDGDPIGVIDEQRDEEDPTITLPLTTHGGVRRDLRKVCVA